MSKRINVNPDHYKTAGREPPGKGITQEVFKQQFATALKEEKKAAKRSGRSKKASAR
jgi:hypothetical protein